MHMHAAGAALLHAPACARSASIRQHPESSCMHVYQDLQLSPAYVAVVLIVGRQYAASWHHQDTPAGADAAVMTMCVSSRLCMMVQAAGVGALPGQRSSALQLSVQCTRFHAARRLNMHSNASMNSRQLPHLTAAGGGGTLGLLAVLVGGWTLGGGAARRCCGTAVHVALACVACCPLLLAALRLGSSSARCAAC